jgi:hypothetical protein
MMRSSNENDAQVLIMENDVPIRTAGADINCREETPRRWSLRDQSGSVESRLNKSLIVKRRP